MSSPKTGPEAAGIPQQIIEQFLGQLTAEKVSPDVVARLTKTLLKEEDFSETAIKAALTADNEAA